ncbi:MAG: Fur family transcriptional regulator [Minisyncoccia bacterium]
MDNFSAILRQVGFRATPRRLSLLNTLSKERKPLTVAEIQRKLGRSAPDTVTLYRALEALAEKGILERTELGHGHAHFELPKKHHHHIVCTACGRVEDFSSRVFEAALQKIKSNSFEIITTHSVELFGRCAKCA